MLRTGFANCADEALNLNRIPTGVPVPGLNGDGLRINLRIRRPA